MKRENEWWAVEESETLTPSVLCPDLTWNTQNGSCIKIIKFIRITKFIIKLKIKSVNKLYILTIFFNLNQPFLKA